VSPLLFLIDKITIIAISELLTAVDPSTPLGYGAVPLSGSRRFEGMYYLYFQRSNSPKKNILGLPTTQHHIPEDLKRPVCIKLRYKPTDAH
jgi:hypothetical protein